jgi:hypothetical protein
VTARAWGALLPAQHPGSCPVCGGRTRMQVAALRPRGEQLAAAWIPARVVWCPLRSNADDLRALVGGGGS